LNHAKCILILGSVIAFVSSSLAAFVPSLASITVSASWSNFLIPNAPRYLTYPQYIFGVHELTLKLLVTAIGGLLGMLSFFERRTSVPFLSFSGISLGTIGFLLPAGATPNFIDVFSVEIPWAGYFIALIGVLMMFLGFALSYPNVPRKALASVPLLLVAYSIAPFLILTNNLPLFIFMHTNITMSTIIGILILAGHLVIIWAGISGLRFPEKEAPTQGT
jgi:hypothetical protein